ncbi:MAG: AraC family transcriptional regulator [Planctomycetes bacterium]|nr:AraC family transcriptional regulator [Planctomycetota bacterium]
MTNLLSFSPIASTSDTDEAQSMLSRELCGMRFQKVRDHRSFHFRMNGIRLGRTMIGYNHFDTDTEVDAGHVEDALIFVTSIGAPTITNVDGESIDCSERGAIISPSRRVGLHRPANSGALIVKMKFESIESKFHEIMGRVLGKTLNFERSVSLANGVGAHTHRILNFIVDELQRDNAILKNPLLRASYDELLVNALLALPNNYSNELMEGSSLSVAPRLVRKAEEFIYANATKPITISDVVAHCECSRRALFNTFNSFRGYTPMQFLAESRLSFARKTLLAPAPTDTVTSIAYVHGFSHLGRFSAVYRKRFGENPLDTLRKAQT